VAGGWLVVVTGWTGAGKSTMAERIAADLGATVASFDWVMSGLRALPEVWAHVELPVERQRRVGWNLLLRIAEQQLSRGGSCVLDLVAREEPRVECQALADRYGARLAVVECTCVDVDLHRRRVEGRRRGIPGWYELTWEHVAAGRERYQPLAAPKLVVDAADPVEANVARVRAYLRGLA
jgi:predicted kinase